MAIHESGEDYLEAILMIQKRNGNVRSIDICDMNCLFQNRVDQCCNEEFESQ